MINIITYRVESNENEVVAMHSFDADVEVISIGRARDNDIILENPLISKYHVKIIVEKDKIVVQDLDSTNGVRVLDIVHSRQVNRARIKNGDSIEIGNYMLQFYYQFDENASTKKQKVQVPLQRQATNFTKGKGLNVFISYSHKDERYREQLEVHLKLLERQRIITTWSARQILPGDLYADAVHSSLESADIILPLISSNFISSNYCYDIEMQKALEKHRDNESWFIPIILRDCDWKHSPFAKFEVLPKGGKPINRWTTTDAAWSDIIAGLRRVAEHLQRGRPAGRLNSASAVAWQNARDEE